MIRIVADSGANFPAALAEKYDVAIVPLVVQFGEASYREGLDMTTSEFFGRLATANPLPTTSTPAPADFEEVYREIVAAGDEIISIHLSSKLSGTLNSARNAASSFEETRISIVDSKSASAGIALLVLTAAKMVAEGRSRGEIVAELERLADATLLILTLDTLEYLKRGGRIGGAKAFLGGLLKVKPVIMLKDGVIEPVTQVRSRRKALEQIVQMEVDRFGNQPVWVALAHGMAEDMPQLEELARERLNTEELLRAEIGPVIATHTGPGVLGIAAMPAPQL